MSLESLKGVGSVTLAKLEDAGITTVEALAKAEIDDLEDAGISERKADTLISRASRNTIVLQSGDEVVNEYESKAYLPSGMDEFDTMLGGGYREGHIIGVSGESSSGKTQLVFHSLVHAVETTGKPAVYIETERDRYEPERIEALSNDEETQSKIYRLKAYSLEQQLQSYEKVVESLDDVCMVAIDSFTARFRLSEQFEDRSTLSNRTTVMAKHFNRIEDMTERLDCPVLLTLQVYGTPSAYSGGPSTWGGELMNHTMSYFIKMSHAQGTLKRAQLYGHPGESDGEVYLSIGSDQLEAMKEA